MAKPYSMDLRERVMEAIRGGQTREAVARRFEISLSSVGRYIKRFREKGSLAPDKFGGHKRHALADEEERLRDWIKERPDMTLEEIQDRLHDSGIEVGRTAIWNFLRHVRLTYKKKRCTRRSRSARTSRRLAKLGLKTCRRSIRRSSFSSMKPGQRPR
jgi:transposase